jgi:hypothetical protein
VEVPRRLAGDPEPIVAVGDARLGGLLQTGDQAARVVVGFRVRVDAPEDHEVAGVEPTLDVDAGRAERRREVLAGVRVNEVDDAVAVGEPPADERRRDRELGLRRAVEGGEVAREVGATELVVQDVDRPCALIVVVVRAGDPPVVHDPDRRVGD